MKTGMVVGVLAAVLSCSAAWADEVPEAAGDPVIVSAREAPDCECYRCACREAATATCPPKKYELLRYDEAWRQCLCVDPCRRGDLTDAWKAVGLTCNKTIWANFGGQLRLRFESWRNQAFGAPFDASDSWLLVRARAHADIHFGDRFRLFVEGIYADIEERELGPRPIDENTGDLLNLFVEVGNERLSAWAGRHELKFGDQRLIGPLDWSNTRREWQGVGGQWSRGFHSLEAFGVERVRIVAHEFDDTADVDTYLYGVNYKNDVWTTRTLEGYVFGVKRDTSTWGARTSNEHRITVGGRAQGKVEGTRLDYEAEAAVQFGSAGDADIFAGMVSGTLGWKPCARCLEPCFALGLDWASGDDDPDDDTIGTYDQLYPTAHKYFGICDLLGRQNLLAARLEASIDPADKLTLKLAYHGFWRANDDDGVYGVAGALTRPGTSADSSFLGTELDLVVTYALDRHWRFAAGWGHFFTGKFFSDTGADDEVDFIYLEGQYTF